MFKSGILVIAATASGAQAVGCLAAFRGHRQCPAEKVDKAVSQNWLPHGSVCLCNANGNFVGSCKKIYDANYKNWHDDYVDNFGYVENEFRVKDEFGVKDS